jgi:two-component system sensor histidine kinase UhpB
MVIHRRRRRDNEAALRHGHAEIEDFAGRLIAAQEAERARIARRLHDDISQRLAAISIAMSECQRSELHAGGELLEVLADVQQQIIALVEDVRLLSHDLHPGMLEHADLVDAVRNHCAEFARQHSLDVVFDADTDLIISDLAISLCLYRVTQEALRNVAKHADARQVQVTVRRVEEEVQLVVVDDGKGFTLSKARGKGGGLGLRIIEERIRLVGGRLSIETAPHMGTTITVWVRNLTSAVEEFAGVSV